MSEWWTYRLDDFLLFSPRTYWRLFEAQNAALWPLPLATTAAGLAALLLILFRAPGASLGMGLVFGVVWAFVGYSFLLERYATINWAVAYLGPAFFIQALLMGGAALRAGALAFRRLDGVGVAGLTLALVALLVFPVLPLAAGRPFACAEVFGIAPDPTVIATIGVLLIVRGGWLAVLLPIPLLWCVFSGLTLLAMDETQAWLLLGAPALTFGLGVVRFGPRWVRRPEPRV
ncbi:DUF6064 family protein [Aquabacter spiritensis]|uniref:MFS transporter permease n=1 Tax=Aquabacter spiritensis TaxID=933073 RepID=A0A4R3LS70_9HYPH|nr:DUF6064 family protein [Aquabacter spiritensis]TCT02636.1 hypothetical protein EDC64_11270 [Aquabacter spiritensis]